jgi:RNA-directed DNA polymerase
VESNASDVRVSGAARKGQGEALSVPGSDEALCPRLEAEDTGPGLLAAVLARENMQQAMKRVRSNEGAAGIDGLGIDETAERLMWEWPVLRCMGRTGLSRCAG